MKRSSGGGSAKGGGGGGGGGGAKSAAAKTEAYLQRSQQPLVCLAFLLPFVLLYEIGTRCWAVDPVSRAEQRIIAFNLMQDFFRFFGASGRYLPAAAVVVVLICWHVARHDRWRIDWGTLAGMTLESAALGLPLLAAGYLSAHYLPLAAVVGNSWRSYLVLSLGAGIYEELVFRLAAFTILSIVLIDLLRIPKRVAIPAMVAISAVAFAGYHYLGNEDFQWRSFIFRTFAGVYFGVIFWLRGFGVTAGSHIAYDIIWTLI